MKYTLLITGVIYQCKNTKTLGETMDHLEQDKPTLCLVRKTSHDYGIEVEAKERRAVRGKVSRFDLLDVLELMRLKGFGTLKGKVVSVCREGGWFMMETDAPDDFVSGKALSAPCWQDWQRPAIPLLTDIPGHEELESVICYLDAALHCAADFDVETTVESIADLIDMSKYDVSQETQMALKDFRRLVDASPHHEVRDMLPTLVRAINDMGSSRRMEEYDEVFYQMIAESDEAADMINAWYSSFAYTKADDMTLEDIRREKLREIEYSLQSLPDDLYREVDRKGRLLHLLLYKAIPYDKLRALLSALVMRDHLLDELETVMAFTNDEEQQPKQLDSLDTAEAWLLWRKAQEHRWVDENRQPLVSQKRAALLASVMAELLNLSPRWAAFERLWGIPDLANKRSQAALCSYYAATYKEYTNALTPNL